MKKLLTVLICLMTVTAFAEPKMLKVKAGKAETNKTIATKWLNADTDNQRAIRTIKNYNKGKEVFKEKEDVVIPLGLPKQVVKVPDDCLAEGKILWAKLAKVLGMNVRELKRINGEKK